MIGDDVVLTVLEVRGDVVRVGIAAPRAVRVHREEVFREVEAANRRAAAPGALDAAKGLAGLLAPPSGASTPTESRDPPA
jgi:carbon storage regulator